MLREWVMKILSHTHCLWWKTKKARRLGGVIVQQFFSYFWTVYLMSLKEQETRYHTNIFKRNRNCITNTIYLWKRKHLLAGIEDLERVCFVPIIFPWNNLHNTYRRAYKKYNTRKTSIATLFLTEALLNGSESLGTSLMTMHR